jgi:hypothetical protein
MTQLLLIQNHGEAPVEGYTVLGYSSTRNCGVDGTIGQFGSGAKHAVNLCLRNGLRVWVYCGKTRLEFSLEKETVNDGLRDDDVWHVTYRKGNAGNFKRAGWILDFGVLDWDDVGMAIREFVSNAIDRTIKEESDITEAKNAGRLSIKLVEEDDRRAKSGFTRIYVEVNDDIREYFAHLGKKFLHFSDNPAQAKPGLIEKKTEGPAQIYRAGVWIRELTGDSVFDYNFTVDEIKIDECRNSSEYYVKAACARRLRNAETNELSQVMEATLNNRAVVEADFDEDYMTGYGDLTESQSERWTNAWEAAAGPDAVVCDNQFSKDYAEKKGHPSKQMPANWAKAIRKAGVKSALDVLSVDEQRGRTQLDATPDAQAAVDWAWELCQLTGLAGEREKPAVFCFQQLSTAEAATNGYQNAEGVHIHVDIANAGQNNELRKTALEEVTHWITGATDNSRDFQNFLLDTIVSLA